MLLSDDQSPEPLLPWAMPTATHTADSKWERETRSDVSCPHGPWMGGDRAEQGMEEQTSTGSVNRQAHRGP